MSIISLNSDLLNYPSFISNDQNLPTFEIKGVEMNDSELDVVLDWIYCSSCNSDLTNACELPMMCKECQGKWICYTCYKINKKEKYSQCPNCWTVNALF